MFGRRLPMPILSVILEKGEKSVERQVIEAMVGARDVYLVSVHTVQDYEAASRRVEAESGALTEPRFESLAGQLHHDGDALLA